SLFESVLGLYLVLLPDLTIVAASDAYIAATLTQRNEITGKKLFEAFPGNPDDGGADGVANLKSSLDYVLENKTAHTMAVQKYDIRRADGTFEERYWSPINKPVLSTTGDLVYIIHRVEDVTELVKREHEQEVRDKITDDLRTRTFELEAEVMKRSIEIQNLNKELEEKVVARTAELNEVTRIISDYKIALDASSIVAITDAKGIIKAVNDNFCNISKYSREELVGADHRIVNSGYHSKEFMRNLWQTIAAGKVWKGELRNRAKDGTNYWVDTTIVPFLNDNGKPYQYVAIRFNITQRKLAEDEIRKLNEELEVKVKERTLELAQALEREKDLSELKSRFVTTAAHEFRTPLSTILSSVSLIERYLDPEHADKRQRHIVRVKSSIRNLTDILNDFLSLDKLEQGKMEMENVTFLLPEACHAVTEDLRELLKEGQNIHYTHTGDDTVHCDRKILRNILVNLLSNAIKYSPEGKSIWLESEQKNGEVTIRVKDEGIGIPADEQKHLFEKFFRARNAGEIQGTGLGLSIVRRYVDLLDGTISFVSKAEQGTVFTVRFISHS
ncbi:MAG TPA: ATP-binding protein, partial [Chitinophagales bacterium]|nr:ATP-binding protein [Chitinophagales bacterium]